MKKISFTISKIIGNVCPSLSLNVELKSQWNDLIGSDLIGLVEFIEAKYERNKRIAIFVNVLNSAAVIFKYQSEEIKERIKKLTGASEIRLITKQISNIGEKNAA